MKRSILLLIGLVSSSHLLLLGIFFDAGLIGQAPNRPASRLSLQVVEERSGITARPEIATPVPQLRSIKKPRETPEKPTDPLAEVKPGKTNEAAPDTSESSNRTLSPFFDRGRFLDAAELDQSAAAPTVFDQTLDKTLPTAVDLIVLEFLIDESGQTVQITCTDGDCSAQLVEKLQQLMVIPFSPAIKNGRPVASRKVIQISPTPTFGL